MTDTPVTDPTPVAHAPPASSYSSGGLSPERVVIWILLIAAIGFWVPYMFAIDHVMWVAHQ